ncbi:MAG TPA: 5-formyltetrahydrofolate cyclo-ligase [Candidatus Saccharimonadia bacterium]|jgi:5-formyltetrahydrofolate cyclo-ligase|nr:5-formyltetrahydrofolate cyclo-ligase [Candidatus Saccharimonadia bacterium]
MIAKDAARQQGRTARAALNPATRAGFNQRIVTACQGVLEWPAYRRMMVFLPIEAQQEIDLTPLVQWVWQTQPELKVYVPRVVGNDLEVVNITPVTPLQKTAWGVPEPVGGEVLQPGEGLDVILVPLLAFDTTGHRVGYGRGYYDRLLAVHTESLRIGIAYEAQRMIDGIEAGPLDQALDGVMTEQRWTPTAQA